MNKTFSSVKSFPYRPATISATENCINMAIAVLGPETKYLDEQNPEQKIVPKIAA